MKQIIYISIFISTIFSCNSQTEKNPTQLVGGPCEDCDAALDYKLLNFIPNSIDTLIGFNENRWFLLIWLICTSLTLILTPLFEMRYKLVIAEWLLALTLHVSNQRNIF